MISEFNFGLNTSTELDFYNPKRVVFGTGITEKRLPSLLKELKPKHLLVVSDDFLKSNSILGKIESAINISGMTYSEHLIPIGEPVIELSREVTEFVRKNRPDLIIGIGGGSVMDVTKLMSIMANNPGDPWDYLYTDPNLANDKVRNNGIRKILIPTTSGTGSEVTNVLTTIYEGRKYWIQSEKLIPEVSFVDPVLTYSLPPAVTRDTGLEALGNLVEGTISNMSNPISEGIISQGVRLISRSLLRAYNNGKDELARANMSLAATLGGWVVTFPWSAVSTIGHCISEIIGPKFNLPHGFSTGIMLPHAMDYNLSLINEKLRNVAEMFGTDTHDMDSFEAAKVSISNIIKLMKGLDMPIALKYATNHSKDELMEMIDEVVQYRQHLYNLPLFNPRRLTRENIQKLFEDLWEGRFSGIFDSESFHT